MSIHQLRDEVEMLITRSGMKPSMKMGCSILKTLKMRHRDIDVPLTREVIHSAIAKHL